MVNHQQRAFLPGPITQAQQAQQAQQQAQLQQGAKPGQQQANSNRKIKGGNGKSKAWQCAQSQMWAQLSKTKMCKYMVNGTCTKGAQCNFAHSKVEIQALPDLSCTKLCKTFVKLGMCDKPGCQYAHTKDELRATSDFHKTKLCRFWPLGNCELGSKCRFAHTSIELRPSVPSQNQMTNQLKNSNNELQLTDDMDKEIDEHGRLVVNRDSESRMALMSEPYDQDMAVSQYEPQDQMMMQGGYQKQSYPTKPPALPRYPPAPQQLQRQQKQHQQAQQMQHQPHQRQQRQQRQLFYQQYPSNLHPNTLPARQRNDMKSATRANQARANAPLGPACPGILPDEDPEGFGDSDYEPYDPKADYGFAGSDDASGKGSGRGTPPLGGTPARGLWADWSDGAPPQISCDDPEEQENSFHIPGPTQDEQEDMERPMHGWMPGFRMDAEGQMQGQPVGMVPMMPVWGPVAAESGDSSPNPQHSPGQMDQSYTGQLRGSGDHQRQFANSNPQAMSVPYGWRPMIGVMMAPPNNHCAPPAQGGDGSWQVKNTFVTYSSENSQMYPLLSLPSGNGGAGNYMEDNNRDAPWMGQ